MGTCSISWRLSPFQASSGGCTAMLGTYLAFSNCTRHTQAHTDTDTYVTCDSLMLILQRSRYCVLPLASCVLSYDIIDSEEPRYPPREKGSGEDRWRWGQVLSLLKLHSLQFLLPGTAKNVLSGYGKCFCKIP